MSISPFRRVVILVACLPMATACVLPDEIAQLQKSVADVQQQLSRVERDQEEVSRRLEEMATDAPREEQASRADLAQLRLQIDQIARQSSITAERVGDLDQRLDRYSQEVQQSQALAQLGSPAPSLPAPPARSDPSPPAPTGGEAFPDPEALYNTAYADFSKGNYSLAVSGFQEYQQRFPDSALADNALYWVAECHFSQGGYVEAVDALDNLLGRYPDSDKAAAANLKKALAFQERNQIAQAIIQYRYVVSAFPDTDEARLARDKLAGLGASPG